MHKPQHQVQQFHLAVAKQPTSPNIPAIRDGELRAALIIEEALETAAALVGCRRAAELVHEALSDMPTNAQPDLVAAIDGIVDTIYVAYGAAEALGIDLEPFYDEVHASNMAKANGKINAIGKLEKPADWTPPDIAGVLAQLNAGTLAEPKCWPHGVDCQQCAMDRILDKQENKVVRK